MSTRSKRFLTFLLCAVVVNNLGCTTTTHRVGPPQAPMDNHEIGKGENVLGAKIEHLGRVGASQAAMDDYGIEKHDYVLVRKANKDDSQIDRKRQNWRCRVARTVHASLMMYANPGFIPVYVADYLKRRKASQ